MKVLDLFSGIGGFSLAAHWMGWETAAFVERDKFCQRVLRKNFGEEIEIYDDITTFDGRPFRGTVDIVTGGFPCQPFSAAGKRKGRDDERHLFPQMLRVIREVEPLWVVAENVRGLLSIESGSVFAEVVASLESEGYEVVTFCVPASALEAPHRRDRLWIVGNRSDGKNPARHPESTGTATIETILSRCRQSSDTERDDCLAADTDDRERSGAVIGCEPAHAGAGLDGRVIADARDTRLQRGELAGTSGKGTRPSRSVAERHSDDSDANGGIGEQPPGSNGRFERRQENEYRSAHVLNPDGTNAGIARRLGVETDDAGSGRCGHDLGRGRERVDGLGDATNAIGERARGEGVPSSGDDRRGTSQDRSAGIRFRDGQKCSSRTDAATFDGGWREHWYEAAARFCRVDDGVSDRVHRLKSLGNSIVPQIAFEIFRAIEAAESER